jgi:hypothetical protein
VLGGTPEAFTATYGAPVGLDRAYEYTRSTGTGVFLWINVTVVPAGERVAQLFIQPTDKQPWDASTEEALYTAYFPPDAVHVRDIDDASGTHHVYKSAALAATLPPLSFRDSHGNALDPGTFDAVCTDGPLAGSSGSICFVTPGMAAV